MLLRTPLYAAHVVAHGLLVDFAGWEMPLHYGSQLKEHHAVRTHAGIFDVSHMGVIDVEGCDAAHFLRYLLANDVAKLKTDGQALYSCMLNPDGGVVDDLIVYRMGAKHFRLVVNAGTRTKDLEWLQRHTDLYEVTVTAKPDYAILALQGPQALNLISQLLDEKQANALKALRPFQFIHFNDQLFARTGYTGEDGVEMVIPADKALFYWEKLIAFGATPCGLGARDTLRLEAGYNLYGTDMDEKTSPLVANLTWTIALQDAERLFIGRDVIMQQRELGVPQQFVGLVMQDPGVLRNHQPVYCDGKVCGEITSGGFSPTLGHAIALARLPVNLPAEVTVERRGKFIPVKIVKPAFVRHAKNIIQSI